MKIVFVGAKGGVGCTSFALLLGKNLDHSIYVSLNFGRKDASLALNAEAPIYDLYDACNRGADLEECIIKTEKIHLLEGPLLKNRQDLNLEGLKKVLEDLEKTYDHILLDLGPAWKDLEEILDPQEVFFLSSSDRAGLYAMDQVKFNHHRWLDTAVFLFTGVSSRQKLLDLLDQEGLSFKEVKTLPRVAIDQDGEVFSYPEEFIKIYTDSDCKEIVESKKGLFTRLLRG